MLSSTGVAGESGGCVAAGGEDVTEWPLRWMPFVRGASVMAWGDA